MANHRQIAWNKKAAPYVTAALALEVVSLFGFAYLTDSHVPGISPLAATSIFIDGTKDIIPTGDPQDPHRMKDALSGAYDQCSLSSCDNNVYVDYPRDFGILTGGVGYDVSRGMATDEIVKAVTQARYDQTHDADLTNDNDPIYVVGYSQGANASSDAIKRLQEEGVDTSNVTFVMLGNGARNDGGLWSRLPAGVYVPLLGLDFGASTNPVSPSDDPNAPQVLLITKQYDGAGDWPKYVLVNPLAAANAAVGFIYVHNGYYQDVTFDPKAYDVNNNGKLDPSEIDTINADGRYIVTSNGNVTDVLIKNQPGDLPITQPLKDLGVPEDLIKAIDPLLRSVIDAGYQRPTDGVYPTQPVHFGLIPKPGKIFKDFLAIEAGADQTGQNLGALNPLQAAAPNLGNALAKQGDVVTLDAPPAPPERPKPPATPHPGQQPFQLQQFIQPPTQTPPVDQRLVVETQVVDETLPPAGEGNGEGEVIKTANQSNNQQNVHRPSMAASPSRPGLAAANAVGSAIKNVVNQVGTAVTNIVTPKPPTDGAGTHTSTAPADAPAGG